MNDTIFWIITGLPIFILSGSFHEYMHAWTAKKLGDYTATSEGRLTMNPLAHIDPWGLLLMIFAHFGWMKPVPVNEYNFKNRVGGMALVALAGPISNIFLALIGIALYILLSAIFSSATTFILFVFQVIYIFIWVNLALAAFNLLPIPPLDGFRILRALLPNVIRSYWESLENYSFIILLLLFIPGSPLSGFIGGYIEWFVNAFISIIL